MHSSGALVRLSHDRALVGALRAAIRPRSRLAIRVESRAQPVTIKRCVVAYAKRDEQFLWNVELPERATVTDALAAARELAKRDDVPWDTANIGIFGQACRRSDVPVDGDRIEIYRPLASDPRERRRERVRNQRRSGRASGG
jgi:putative ubiquitin-RnfH superfamily antitoxin RatB of RatAB toxin-antitoxin module